jgi:membrane-bound metal-dependent hydrolase YbcI (DUF457 family)
LDLDNLTHSLFAATLGRTPLGRAGRGTTATLLLASNAPDLDIVAVAGGGIKYLEWHRGMTHGPLGLIGLAFICAAIVEIARRVNPKWRHPDDATFAMLVAVAAVGIVFHVLMDLPTTYGIRGLSPFTWRWYAVDWMPIIDVYLLIALGSGLFLGRLTEEARRRNAVIVLTFVAAIYGVRAFMHHQALDIAPRLFGPTLPPRCDVSPDIEPSIDSWPKAIPTPPPSGRRCLVEIAAIPTFMSPFDWRIVAQMSNAYEIHDVNLLDGRFREPERESEVFWRQTLRYPNLWTPEARRAAATRTGQVFLGFSRFPAVRTAHDANGAATVRFTDMRFVGGPALSDQPVRRVQPFTITIRFDSGGNVISEALGQ